MTGEALRCSGLAPGTRLPVERLGRDDQRAGLLHTGDRDLPYTCCSEAPVSTRKAARRHPEAPSASGSICLRLHVTDSGHDSCKDSILNAASVLSKRTNVSLLGEKSEKSKATDDHIPPQ